MDRSRLLYPRLTWTEDEYRIAEQMAREGNCWAQYEMARYIMGNRSIPEDAWQLSGEDAQSYLFWLKRAASGGLPWAQYCLQSGAGFQVDASGGDSDRCTIRAGRLLSGGVRYGAEYSARPRMARESR